MSGKSRGLKKHRSDADFPELSFEEIEPDAFRGGAALCIAWADYNNDGYLDVAVGYEHGELRLYRNEGGDSFVNIGPEMGFPLSGPSIRGLAWGDFNASGFPSLYVGTAGDPYPSRNLLFRNEAGMSFKEVAEELGVDLPAANSRQVMWLDYNNSGRLSLLVVQRAGSLMAGGTVLFRNDGDGFTNVSREVGLFNRRRGVGACFMDFHRTGYLDIFVGSQDGDRDSFFRNDAGTFTNVARELKVDRGDRNDGDGTPGCAIVDFDNSGHFDLFLASYGPNVLYKNDGKGSLIDVAASAGMGYAHEYQCGCSWGDLRLSGRLDLYVGMWGPRKQWHKDHLYINTPEGFVDALPECFARRGVNHTVHFVDFDNDGVLDVSLASGDPEDPKDSLYGSPGRPGINSFALFRNRLDRGGRRSLSVRVLDAAGHSTQAGAEVRLFAEDGTLLGSRVYNTTGGYDSQSDMPVFFGIRSAGKVDIEVTFMSASGRVVKWVRGVNPEDYDGTSIVIRRNPQI